MFASETNPIERREGTNEIWLIEILCLIDSLWEKKMKKMSIRLYICSEWDVCEYESAFLLSS